MCQKSDIAKCQIWSSLAWTYLYSSVNNMKLHSFSTQLSAAHYCGATAVSEPRVLTGHQARLEEIGRRTGRRVKAHICWFKQGEYFILDVVMQKNTSMRRGCLWRNYLVFSINKNKLIILRITDRSFHHLHQNKELHRVLPTSGLASLAE